MCGIAGYILKKSSKQANFVDPLLASIRQRGPDDEGVLLAFRNKKRFESYRTEKTVESLAGHLKFIEQKNHVCEHDIAMIHTRYSIIDLSDGGHQPFLSQDQSIAVVFNGEIYNYIELREELIKEGFQFRTESDTEVLVEGYCVWGERLWEKLNGFWAVAIYDFNKNVIVFSRDRIGVAPLYYRETQEGLFFASSIQSLVDVSPNSIAINEDAVLGFIDVGFKDHDQTTCYEQIYSVPSKSYVLLSGEQHSMKGAQCKQYWDFPQNRLQEADISLSEAVDNFRDCFFDAVKLRLRSDVKVAFELSGGLDSSSIVAAACQVSSKKITTYTVKIKDADEEPYARAMLDNYKIDYHVIENMEDQFLNDYDHFSHVMEEPYDNPNAYSHHQMLRMMKKEGVHVVVTGAGGDEVFGGYEASFWPAAYRELKASGLANYLKGDWYEFCRRFKTVKKSRDTLRHYMEGPFKKILKMKKNNRHCLSIKNNVARDYQNQYQNLSFHRQALFHFNTALVPFYMRSSDHFTMGIPVEHRFPLLDYRIVELGLKLPINYLFSGGWSKYILRRAMEPFLPKKILWRKKKMGFDFPFKQYFTKHKSRFAPKLQSLENSMLKIGADYDSVLHSNPAQLWRLLSVGIWLDNK